jgi:diketogulonate reductase-like aldo/keto reductase
VLMASFSTVMLAYERGVAVIANEPFAHGQLFRMTKGKPVPRWCEEFGIQSWSQYFLKFILSSEKIPFVIPATQNLSHLQDNMQAARGRLLSPAERLKMKKEF